MEDVGLEGMNWIIKANLDNGTDYQLYTSAYYFTVTTISTVGYGDISGNNSIERIIIIFVMILGVVVLSFFTGKVLAII